MQVMHQRRVPAHLPTMLTRVHSETTRLPKMLKPLLFPMRPIKPIDLHILHGRLGIGEWELHALQYWWLPPMQCQFWVPRVWWWEQRGHFFGGEVFEVLESVLLDLCLIGLEMYLLCFVLWSKRVERMLDMQNKQLQELFPGQQQVHIM